MLKQKQGGFTLLELLVVITLLAVLSVGALVAYEGIGENANNVAAANNIKTADSSIRAYRAIENAYPNQWDNLANLGGEVAGGAFGFLADATKGFFGQWVVPSSANATWVAVADALESVGIDELQTLQTTSTFGADVVPNLAFNESEPSNTADPADELEFDETGAVTFDGAAHAGTFALSIVPSSVAGVAGDCTAGTVSLTGTLSGATVADSKALNLINDSLDNDGCHLVLALGFGKDVPGTTLGSRVAISTAPTYTNGNVINPSTHYARYIALFQVGSDGSDGSVADGDISAAEVFNTPRLIAVVDTEGRTIDQAIAGAYTSSN